MTAPDPALVEAALAALFRPSPGAKGVVMSSAAEVETILAAVEPLIRAGERRKVVAEYATWGPTVQMIPRAEADAVAARLVEVEVSALREQWLKWATVHACCEAGLVASPDPCPWHPNGRLADLRAKVEALPTWDGYYEPVVVRREVLALFDEEDSDE